LIQDAWTRWFNYNIFIVSLHTHPLQKLRFSAYASACSDPVHRAGSGAYSGNASFEAKPAIVLENFFYFSRRIGIRRAV
jgi:hypothetical protein